jgi:hypothetical protein
MAEVAQETIDQLLCQIGSLQEQLATLRAQVEKLGSPRPVRTLADLFGILPDLDTSAEEIDAVCYRMKWEGDEPAEEAR